MFWKIQKMLSGFLKGGKISKNFFCKNWLIIQYKVTYLFKKFLCPLFQVDLGGGRHYSHKNTLSVDICAPKKSSKKVLIDLFFQKNAYFWDSYLFLIKSFDTNPLYHGKLTGYKLVQMSTWGEPQIVLHFCEISLRFFEKLQKIVALPTVDLQTCLRCLTTRADL